MCRHRGNKLVWQDEPADETSGTCRQFTCKYHGWRYGLDGDLTFIQQEQEFFDIDKRDYGLASVQVDIWEGFIFVNLDRGNTVPVREYLGKLGAGLEGYPFGELTEVYQYRARINSNWKLYIDAFARVLPRTGAAREAVRRRRVAEAHELRLRGPVLRDGRSPRDAIHVGRHGATEGRGHGQADRTDPALRQFRPVGPA